MSQPIRSRIRDQIRFLRFDPIRLFSDLLDRSAVEAAVVAESVFSRPCFFSATVTLWTFLCQVLDPDHSCRAALSTLIAYLTALGQPTCSADTGPYCKARRRLPLGVLKRLVRSTGQKLDEQVPEPWKWKGRRVHLVDGTTVSMPDTPANQQAFPQPQSQAHGLGFPLARLVAIISLGGGAIRDLAVGPYKGKETGETALLRALWNALERGDILLGDRYFASFFGIAGLVSRGVDGVFRMHQRRDFNFRRGVHWDAHDHIVTWFKPARPAWMDQAHYEQMPNCLCIRELKFRVDVPGFRVEEIVLVTTLLDARLFPKEELAELYFDRWNVELDLRSIKIEMSMDVLRCKTPEMVEKEIWVHLLAYNLIRTLIAASAQEHGTEPRRLSFTGAMQALRAHAQAIRYSPASRRETLIDQLLCAIASHEVGNRPGRVEPRAIKRRPKPHPLLTEPRWIARKRLLRAT